jgi:predicted RNA binding protein YcfA (HicA-like mRNA interferase family)
MVKRDKRIEAMRRHPYNVRPDELDAILRHAGFRAHQEGGHKTYRRAGQKITVPQHGGALKAIYVRQALDLLDAPTQEEDQ